VRPSGRRRRCLQSGESVAALMPIIMTTSSLTQGPAARVIDLAPETPPVKRDCPAGPVLSGGTSFSPPQATRENKASALTDGTVGSLTPTPSQDNLSADEKFSATVVYQFESAVPNLSLDSSFPKFLPMITFTKDSLSKSQEKA
jgi:hypothetical protein